jgi:hypothetical protein
LTIDDEGHADRIPGLRAVESDDVDVFVALRISSAPHLYHDASRIIRTEDGDAPRRPA